MKHNLRLLMLTLLCAVFGTVWSQESSSGIVFEPVTSTTQLVAGNEYILVAPDYSVAMGAPNTNNNKIRDAIEVTINNNEISISDQAVSILTLGGSAGAWTFYASDTQNYLALNANSNEVHSATNDTENNAKWTITSDFKLQSNNFTNRILQYNSGSPRFACYSSSQKSAVLYVKQDGQTNPKPDPELSFGTTTSFTVYIGSDFTAPTLINPHELEGITYESSNEDIADVDPESGDVTIYSTEGVATITASFDGNDEYNAGSASYTITVEDQRTEAGIEYAETNIIKNLGDAEFVNTLTNPNNVSVVYSSSDENVALVDENTGEIVVQYENCLECGACRIACPKHALKWEYPKGTKGVTFKQG